MTIFENLRDLPAMIWHSLFPDNAERAKQAEIDAVMRRWLELPAAGPYTILTPPLTDPATVDDSAFYAAILDRVGYVDGGEVTAEGSFHNDLAAERADAVISFIDLVRGSALPEELLPAEARDGGGDRA